MFPGRCVGLTTLPPPVPIVLKSGSLSFLEPSRPVQVCNGIALPIHLIANIRCNIRCNIQPTLDYISPRPLIIQAGKKINLGAFRKQEYLSIFLGRKFKAIASIVHQFTDYYIYM